MTIFVGFYIISMYADFQPVQGRLYPKISADVVGTCY